jgi:hypothetical protein
VGINKIPGTLALGPDIIGIAVMRPVRPEDKRVNQYVRQIYKEAHPSEGQKNPIHKKNH